MTRKDFEAVAAVVQEANLNAETRVWLARDFADKFEDLNPRFDRERFMDAAAPMWRDWQ